MEQLGHSSTGRHGRLPLLDDSKREMSSRRDRSRNGGCGQARM
ncbi:hypothetical protein [Salinifilum ghardaiensis]